MRQQTIVPGEHPSQAKFSEEVLFTVEIVVRPDCRVVESPEDLQNSLRTSETIASLGIA